MKLVLVRLFRLLPPSPPARGAWIEMPFTISTMCSVLVAPREGGVD